jgi:glycosyltransferase involved in cell wall biosynthesis
METEDELVTDEVRGRHDIKPEEKIVLYLGRLSIEKRVEDLIRAMKHLGNDTTLLICGKGPYGKKLKRIARKIDKRVIFAGYIPERLKGSYYKAADVFVFPSVGDTQGIVLLEAMKYGTPVVSVKAQGIVDIVEDGKNGLLARAEDPEDISRKIETVLNDGEIRDKITLNQKEVLEKHSWENVTDRLEEIYRNMIENR